ncbi:MAG: heme ABC exporter ATP-binding protein CcmA, partial [Acidobacteriota bacterium]
MLDSSASLLRISGVTKTFGPVRAVINVDLEVCFGDFLVIFGPNGAGKTTLLRMVAGLTQPTRGEISFSSQDGPSKRERVGYVSHQSFLYNQLTGIENLIFYGRLYGIDKAEDRADAMLARMGLRDARHQSVGGYSRGMKQRLTLARALLHEPDLLLLDEPYTGLDQHGSRILTEVLQGLKQEGRTVLLITHNLGAGLELCSRTIIQNKGQLAFQATRQQLDASEFERIYFQVV